MKLNEKAKNALSFLLRLSVSLILLILVFKLNKIDLGQLGGIIKSADPGYLALALLIFLSVNFIILWRWYVFMGALRLVVPFRSVMRWFFIGLSCNLFLPTAIGGDIIKTLGMCQETPDKPKVFASVLLDRLSGFAGIVIVAAIAFFFGSALIKDSRIIISIVALTLLSLATAAVLFNERLYSWACQVFRWWPKITAALMKMHYDIVLLKGRKRDGFFAIGLSCLAQITTAFVFYLIARSLGQDVSLAYFLIFSPMVCVAAVLPSIGGLGVREVAWAYFLTMVGVKSEIAVSVSLISDVFMVLVGIIGGVLYVTSLSSGRIQYHQAGPGTSPKEA